MLITLPLEVRLLAGQVRYFVVTNNDSWALRKNYFSGIEITFPTGISTFLDFAKTKNRPNLLMLFSKIVYPKDLLGKMYRYWIFHNCRAILDFYRAALNIYRKKIIKKRYVLLSVKCFEHIFEPSPNELAGGWSQQNHALWVASSAGISTNC